MPREPTVFIVDDDDAIRDSLQLLLDVAGYARVAAYESSRRFLDTARPQPGDCLLLDVRMPDMDGLQLQAELNRRGVRLPTIVMTGHGDVPIAVRAMKAGAADFIEKPFSEDLLLASVRRALALGAEASRRGEETAETMRRLETLTAREREVLEGMVAGNPNKVIAHSLGISPRTVEIHRARVMDKMQAHNLSALVRMALAAGVAPRLD
jgi:two-component system response regulator FixJ